VQIIEGLERLRGFGDETAVQGILLLRGITGECSATQG